MYHTLKSDMNLSALRALLALRDLASFVRVGEKVNLSPSAVFCQIRQLEDQLDQKLYERQGKLLRLTSMGDLLASHAEKIISVHDSALAVVQPSGAVQREPVRVGCGPSGCVEIMPYLLCSFATQYPETEIRMISSGDDSLLNDLHSGLLDAVFMSLPAQSSKLKQKHLWSYELVLVLPPSESGLYPEPELDDLRTAPFILYRRPVVIDAAQQHICRELGFEFNVVIENDEVDSIKELIKLGLGISFLPLWNVADEARQGKLRILRLAKRQLYTYGLLYRKSRYKSPVLAKLLTVAGQWEQWWPLAKHVSPLRSKRETLTNQLGRAR
jgi:DNA-binding transcriptional LysR family regulator